MIALQILLIIGFLAYWLYAGLLLFQSNPAPKSRNQRALLLLFLVILSMATFFIREVAAYWILVHSGILFGFIGAIFLNIFAYYKNRLLRWISLVIFCISFLLFNFCAYHILLISLAGDYAPLS